MKAYVMDAFSEKLFGGNQAGVALPECPLSDAVMQQIAAEFKHSETAFVTVNDDGSVTLRYFTPAGEVDLCGHATIASFALLRQEGLIADGSHIAHTKASDLNIGVSGGTVWMDMAPPQLLADIPSDERAALYIPEKSGVGAAGSYIQPGDSVARAVENSAENRYRSELAGKLNVRAECDI